MSINTSTPQSVNPKRPRSFWYLKVTEVGHAFEMPIMYKNTRGSISPFSKSGNTRLKIPWGTPIACDFIEPKNPEDMGGEYKFSNRRRDTEIMKETLFSSFEGGINPFVKEISSLILAKKQKILGLYLTHLTHSVGFVHHREGIHSPEGILIEKFDDLVRELCGLGGSLEEYKKFIELARNSASTVAKSSEEAQDISRFFQPKRKPGDSNLPVSKKSKAQIIDDLEKEELNDPVGLEKVYQESFIGLAHINIDNLLIPSDLKKEINETRVNLVMSNIRRRYDPSASIPVVFPLEDDGNPIDLKNVGNRQFGVVQKIHLITAFKELDKSNQFAQLISHKKRTVLCFVIKTCSPEMLVFGNMRGNDIHDRFAKSVRPQGIIDAFFTVSSKTDKANALKLVDRMLRLFRIGPNESTSVRKICGWSASALNAFILVLREYESFGTLDTDESQNRNRYRVNLARGEKLKIPNTMLNAISKINDQRFEEGHQKVIDNECSLKKLVDDIAEASKVENVASVLSKIAGNKPYDRLVMEYEGKFDADSLKTFIGAEIRKGVSNEQATRLAMYYRKVTEAREDLEADVTFNVYEVMPRLMQECQYFRDSEFVVLFIDGKAPDWLTNFVSESILVESRPYFSRIIFFSEEKWQWEVLTHLRSNFNVIDELKIMPLIFHAGPSSSQKVNENVQFAVLFGKLDISASPISIYQSSLENVCSIIENITPPEASVVCIADENSSLSRVHTMDSKVASVSYYGTEKKLEKLITSLEQTKSSFWQKNLGRREVEDSNDRLCSQSQPVQEYSVIEDQSSTSPFKSVAHPTSSKRRLFSGTSGFLQELDKMSQIID